MKGAALIVLGMWVVLQTAKGPLATVLGLVQGSSKSSSGQSGG